MRRRTFDEYIVPRPRPRVTDVVTTLRHFALVTYTIDPDSLRRTLPPRLSPLTIDLDGTPRALLSVVLFMNSDFRPAVLPGPRFTMPQINYRAYVIDESTGDHAIWFLATLLDAWAFLVPRFIWRMPWRKGPIRIGYEYDDRTGLYKSYSVTSHSTWAPADVELIQDAAPPDGADASELFDIAADPAAEVARDPVPDPAAEVAPELELPGFPDVETGLVCLTHAAQGFFRRTDGKIAVNRVWHNRIPVKPARLVRASFPLLERWQLVSASEQMAPYSVLIAPQIGFTSMLPPRVVAE